MHISLNFTILPYKKLTYEKLAKSFYVNDCVTNVDFYFDFEIFRKEAFSF